MKNTRTIEKAMVLKDIRFEDEESAYLIPRETFFMYDLEEKIGIFDQFSIALFPDEFMLSS